MTPWRDKEPLIVDILMPVGYHVNMEDYFFRQIISDDKGREFF